MQDFFGRQDRARRRTTLLLAYFVLAVLLIVLAVYLAARGLLIITANDYLRHTGPISWWDPEWFLWTAGGTTAIILAGTFYQIGQLGQGGRRLAELLDARLLDPGSAEPRERQLLNIVEEIAIAAGMPVPEVYVMDRERGINAFAAGFGINDGIVCVTKGALELLSREELQGVVAHEFSHLLNGDSLINLRLIGWLYGILLLHQVGAGLLRGMALSRRSRSKGPLLGIGLVLWILGLLGYLCGQLIKSAVSRQREHLADASAVQFTRNPLGLAGALKKIGGLDQGSRLRHPQAELASHMYFSSGLKSSWWNAFATHPPLEERIRLLDPAFDGIFPQVEPLPAPEPQQGYVQRPRTGPAAAVFSGAAVMALLERVGELEEEQIARSGELLAALPDKLRAAAREPLEACALLCALLFDAGKEIASRQDQALASSTPELSAACDRLRPDVSALADEQRLLLVDLLLPALRRLTVDQYREMRRLLRALIDADRKVSLFEYAVQRLVVDALDRQFGRATRPVVQIYGMRGVEREAALVLSLLAHVGQDDPAGAATAFARGARVLAEPRLQVELFDRNDCTRGELDRALDRLRQASPQLQRKLLAACLECLTADGTIRTDEITLFRALAATLGIPVPPWMQPSEPETPM